jgi:UDP-3-O-[3-hydroxymyristoyl] glucosamine N-acyltransferase
MCRAEPASAVQLVQAGLLWIGAGCRLHPTAVFLPADLVGTVRRIVLGERVVVGAYAVLHGGLSVGAYGYIGHRAILGEPEYSYAVRDHHPGAGADTLVGESVIVQAGAIVYAGALIGDDATVGHHTVLRPGVNVGAGSVLAANLTVERGSFLGGALSRQLEMTRAPSP